MKRTTPLRVAFIKQKYVRFGGGEGYLSQLMDACLEEGCEVHLITTEWNQQNMDGLKIHAVPRRGLTLGGRSLSFSRNASRVVAANNFDVTMSLERTQHQDVWRAGEGVHKVWLERRSEFQPWFKTALNEKRYRHRKLLELESACVRNTPLIIANSEMVKNDIQRVHGKAGAAVRVIYNGADKTRFNPEGRAESRWRLRRHFGLAAGTKVLLFVGSGFVRKGLKETIAALEHLPECILVVMGRDNPSKWKMVARRRGVEDRILFLRPEGNMQDYFHLADLTMLPSWFDPFPNVGLESLSCGTPLLTSRFAGVHEVLRPGECGEVVESPADMDSMVEAVESQLARGLDERRAARISASVAELSIENNRRKTMAAILE